MQRSWFDPCERCGAPVRFPDEISRRNGGLGLVRRCTVDGCTRDDSEASGHSLRAAMTG